jgi:hypothetical protein
VSCQLELFKENLPHKPYATNSFEAGVKICNKQNALAKKYLQHNPPAKIHWLVFDCDKPAAFETAAQISFLPAPNFEVINPINGHSHLFYGLAVPVVRTDAARDKPLKYLASVEYALRTSLAADDNYGGLISKNPLHPHWSVIERQQGLWSLPELAEYLQLPAKLPTKALTVGLGRNCSLFETARKWAYKSVLSYRVTSTQEAFFLAVFDACQKLNNFPEPLPVAEVKSTAKSIAKWTWKKYTGRLPDDQFSKIQAARARKGKGVCRYRHTPLERSKAVLEALAPGARVVDVAKFYGVNPKTIYQWLKATI